MADRPKGSDWPELERLFREATGRMRRGDTARAKDLFRKILRTEPRLPEPYLELAVIMHQEGEFGDAIAAARIGLDLLDKGGQWVEDLAPHVVLSHAQNLLGELLVAAAQEGETALQPEEFAPLWNEATDLFEAAHRTDPENQRARTNAVLHKRVPSS